MTARALKGLVIASVICLKTTYVPAILLLFISDVVFYKERLAERFKDGFTTLGFALTFGFCWGYAHWDATGSAFYPFFGQGHICIDFPTFLLDGPGTFTDRFLLILGTLFRFLLCNTRF